MSRCTKLHRIKGNDGRWQYYDHHYVAGLCIHNFSVGTQSWLLKTWPNYDGGNNYEESKVDTYAQAIEARRQKRKLEKQKASAKKELVMEPA